MIPWWQHALIFIGALVFVLVWTVRYIEYDNLVKWRWIVRREGNWTWWALAVFAVIVSVAAYSVYWVIIHKFN